MVFNFPCNWKITLSSWFICMTEFIHVSAILFYIFHIWFFFGQFFPVPCLMPWRERERDCKMVCLIYLNDTAFKRLQLKFIWIAWIATFYTFQFQLKICYQLRLLIQWNLIIAQFRHNSRMNVIMIYMFHIQIWCNQFNPGAPNANQLTIRHNEGAKKYALQRHGIQYTVT